MADDDNRSDLMLEHLRAIREDIARLAESVSNVAADVRSVKAHVAALVQSDLHHTDRVAQIDRDLETVKKRLNLIG